MTDTEIKQLFESNGQFATGKDYALIRAFEIIIRQQQQQRTWVGLTFEEICECEDEYLHTFARKIEAKLKEKNW